MVLQHSSSNLLTEEENARLFALLGQRRRSMATAVVQLFMSAPPSHNAWEKVICGVATFTKDASRRSYFIQVFDLAQGQMIWEQELYDWFEYNDSCQYFHSFEAHDRSGGLNFADQKEAALFAEAVCSRLNSRQKRREEIRASRAIPAAPSVQSPQLTVPAPQRSPSPNQAVKNEKSVPNRGKSAQKGRKKLTKEDIGMPTDFRHERHIGFDTELPSVDVQEGQDCGPLIAQFMAMYGVSAKDEGFVRRFIDENGGISRLKREMQAPQTPPTTRAPPPVSRSGMPPPPKLPTTGSPAPRRAPPPLPSGPPRGRQNVPLPPPPSRPPAEGKVPPPPPPIPPPPPSGSIPPPPPSGSIPPPPPSGSIPPPPPLLRSSGPLPQPPQIKDAPQPQTGRSALLDQIRGFSGGLKHVDATEAPTTPPPPSAGSLAALLMNAIDKRRPGLRGSDSENSDFDDNEWSDES